VRQGLGGSMTITVLTDDGTKEVFKDVIYWDNDDNFMYIHIGRKIEMLDLVDIRRATIE
jgi:hypothetical protein